MLCCIVSSRNRYSCYAVLSMVYGGIETSALRNVDGQFRIYFQKTSTPIDNFTTALTRNLYATPMAALESLVAIVTEPHESTLRLRKCAALDCRIGNVMKVDDIGQKRHPNASIGRNAAWVLGALFDPGENAVPISASSLLRGSQSLLAASETSSMGLPPSSVE